MIIYWRDPGRVPRSRYRGLGLAQVWLADGSGGAAPAAGGQKSNWLRQAAGRLMR